MTVLLIRFQTQVTRQVFIAHIPLFCPTLRSSVLSVTFTALPVHYEYKNVSLNILLMFSHEPIAQVCLYFFFIYFFFFCGVGGTGFQQTHYCIM